MFYLEEDGQEVVGQLVKHIKAALRRQPVMVGFQVTSDVYQYKTGIYSGLSCGNVSNHAMIAVGFGKQGNTEFLIIRNTWGVSWGELGYFRVKLTDTPKGGICGVLATSSTSRVGGI